MNTLTTFELPIGSSYRHLVLRRWILGYFLLLCIIAPFNLLAFDTYYYWDWSRHLDLSYYDGPPLIAYIIRLVTFFSGHLLYGLTFISILFLALTARVLYKTAALFLDVKTSYFVTLLWLTLPLVTQDLLTQVTYDTPMTFFWACSVYYAISYVKKNSVKTLYCLGCALGFLLLSKYTGIVLVVCLIAYILFTPYIRLLKNPHFYGAILLAIFIFSPVLFWNIQHHWISFDYQMHAHQSHFPHQGLWSWIQIVSEKILPVLNLMILPPFVVLRQRQKFVLADHVWLLVTISLGFFGFYLLVSSMVTLRNTWLMQYLLTSALLVGWLAQHYFAAHAISVDVQRFKKLINGFIGINAFVSIMFLLNGCLHFIPSKNFIYYRLVQQFNVDYPEKPRMVFTSGWLNARVLFFLKAKPLIYTLNCGQDQNAYQLWSATVTHDIQKTGVKTILFIDVSDNRPCLNRYFNDCERQPTSSISGRSLFVYRCKSPKSH